MLLDGGARTAAKLRRYLPVRSLMSVVAGIFLCGFISLCGLPLAQEWGVIAFALNYIPFIGPLVARFCLHCSPSQFEACGAAPNSTGHRALR